MMPPVKGVPCSRRASRGAGDLSWMADGLCAQIGDDEVFFPEKGKSSRAAIATCRACPVIEACLAYALDTPGREYGVWGGTNERQRAKMRAERNRP